jgi:hypothetical protein
MRAILWPGLAAIVALSLASEATAQQRSREQCQALADTKVGHSRMGERRKFMRRCMEGRLKKDREQK